MPKNKQLQTPTRRHRPFYRHPIFIVILILALLAGGFFGVRYLLNQPKQPAPAASSSQPEVKKSDSAQVSQDSKADTEAPASAEAGSSDGKTPVQYDGADANTYDSLTGVVTHAAFSGDNLIIRVNIDQYLSSGSCTLRLSDGTNQLTFSANVLPEASTSTCEGFDVPVNSLAAFARPLSITIDIVSGDRSGVLTGSVE